MARLNTRFIEPFVEVARDESAAREQLEEQKGWIPALTSDLEKYGGVADYARLGRALSRAADAAYLLREYTAAAELAERSAVLFEETGKENATFLKRLLQVRASVQLGERIEAAQWYEDVRNPGDEKGEKQLELYRDWIDVGYIELLAAGGRYGEALDAFQFFMERWRKRPNVDLTVYIEAERMLRDLAS